MGTYLNPGNYKFQEVLASDIYVDKTGLLKYTNSVQHTLRKYVCVSRPRRFGKSVAVNMLAAYYSQGCDSEKMFAGLEISEDKNFRTHLNQYNTLVLNMQEFLSRTGDVKSLLLRMQKMLMRELNNEYPDVDYFDENDLIESM